MACFIVPATEAIVTTIVAKTLEKKAKKANLSVPHTQQASSELTAQRTPFYKKLQWLNYLLWGGAFLLAFEHVWHGEVVPFFPFLTAAADPETAAQMLHEMATAGVGMALLVTAVWGIIVAVSYAIEKRAAQTPATEGSDA